MTINTGGSAFPQHGWSSDPATIERMQACGGMTLRDYFAAAALQGLIASPVDDVTHAQAAEEAFLYADAMLAERQKAGQA